jgi:hypothetical protein
MERIEISYQSLQETQPGYVAMLKQKEPAVRRALERSSNTTSARWSCAEDAAGNVVFHLHATTGGPDCIAQVLPLDLTLEPEQFEELLVTGARPCIGSMHDEC